MSSDEKISVFLHVHFLHIERSQTTRKGTIKYKIKDHFNKPLVQVEGKSDGDDNFGLQVISLKATRKDSHPSSLFSITVSKNIPHLESETSLAYKACTLISTSGEILGRVQAVKDIGLSTYSYNVTGNSDELLFHISTNNSCEGQHELNITPVLQEHAIARIGIEKGKVSLAMVPELDSLTKIRLICVMVLKKLIVDEIKSED